MSNETIILAFLGVVIALFLVFKYIQYVGLEKVRKQVYKLFIVAEREFQHGANTDKFEYVITWAKMAIPMPFCLFITESLLRKVVQAWFDICKDLLDDGRLNGTGATKKEENKEREV